MSRVGKAPIVIPEGVTVTIDKNVVTATGTKGELSASIRPEVSIKQDAGVITVEIPKVTKELESYHGLSRTLISNLIEGVSKGFAKELEIIGVGFRAEIRGKKLVLNIGYSHPIVLTPPDTINLECATDTKIKVSGADRQLVGQIAANIRAYRKPEPYKGKGIRYLGEEVKRKAGKTAA